MATCGALIIVHPRLISAYQTQSAGTKRVSVPGSKSRLSLRTSVHDPRAASLGRYVFSPAGAEIWCESPLTTQSGRTPQVPWGPWRLAPPARGRRGRMARRAPGSRRVIGDGWCVQTRKTQEPRAYLDRPPRARSLRRRAPVQRLRRACPRWPRQLIFFATDRGRDTSSSGERCVSRGC